MTEFTLGGLWCCPDELDCRTGSSLYGLLEEVEMVSRLLAEDADVVEFVEMVRQANRFAVEE